MRLIDADAMDFEVCEDFAVPNDPNHILKTLREMTKYVVGKAPTVEAEAVRHGRWEEKDWWSRKRHYYGKMCSVCGGIAKYKSRFKYCPHCGARMDGGAGDE